VEAGAPETEGAPGGTKGAGEARREEEAAWITTALGQLRAITRQYAQQVRRPTEAKGTQELRWKRGGFLARLQLCTFLKACWLTMGVACCSTF
jgi:hypothetical protein